MLLQGESQGLFAKNLFFLQVQFICVLYSMQNHLRAKNTTDLLFNPAPWKRGQSSGGVQYFRTLSLDMEKICYRLSLQQLSVT